MNEFKKGDKVRLKDQDAFQGKWQGVMTVDEAELFYPRIGVQLGSSFGAFFPEELELVAALAYSAPDEDPEEPQQPAALPTPPATEDPIIVKDIRIVVGGSIGTTSYPSKLVALQAAVQHGKNDEEFDLVSFELLGKYKVKTEVIKIAAH